MEDKNDDNSKKPSLNDMKIYSEDKDKFYQYTECIPIVIPFVAYFPTKKK